MRRIVLLFVLFFLLLAVMSFSMATAQEPAVTLPPTGFSPTPTPGPLPQSIFLEPIDPQTIDTPLVPAGGNAGGDLCQNAAEVTFLNTAVGGVTPNVQAFTHDNSDPVLSCMWPGASRPNGYRTVWYKFTPVTNAVVTINSDTSNYDTVVGVFTPSDEANACLTLQPVACNDDFNGFTSQVTFTAVQDQTYYVVIADWSAASSGQMTLNIFMQPQPGEEKWELVDNNPGGQVTHHDTVAAGEYIYIVGGQDDASSAPTRSNRLMRYHPPTNSWATMAQIPGMGVSDLTAVHINGLIYVPGGDTGAPGVFDGTHRVYHINGNFWSFLPSPPAAVGWAQAVAAADGSGYYLTGGITEKPVLDPDVDGRVETYFYDIVNNSWLPRPNMSAGRYGHMIARIGNQICVAGGVNGSVLLGSGECLAPFANSWQPIGNLNIPRFGAGSAVGPDGNWYIFGGMSVNANGQQAPVSSTEVYNPATGQWSVLNVPYDLRDPNTVFARAYPAGEFWGTHLYAFGGNHHVPSLDEFQVVPLVQRLYVPHEKQFIPLIRRSGASDFDDHMGAARGLPPNFWYGGNFNSTYDFYDFYFFDLSAFSGVTIQLDDIPAGSNYDLYVFGSSKLLWGSSVNPGNLAETVGLSLSPGRYYVLVQRLYGPSDGSGYQVVVLR
ncbi:MAG: pre-peptidase C-terminal domain-containing protein [Anaerolineae bacterium]|nr:pre-peptidase C-terminal domain-containing protein [Anaerolineae bacterium]